MSHEGWQEYRQSEDIPAGFIYSQMGVVPVQANELAKEPFINQPIVVPGGVTIGTLSIADDPQHPLSSEDISMVQQISEQIALALESARLFDQTQSALAQSEKLFDASRSLTRATDLQELVEATVKTLGISVVNRAVLTTFDYASAGDIEQLTVVANWWNGDGHEVTSVGTRYSREVIQLMPMFVSPTPVFFDDAFADERVDGSTLELVKRQNLRAVAVLPLRLGSDQIGALLLEAEEPHNFTPEETRLFESLAPQIATVLENRQQYEKAQRQAEREAMLNAISQKIQSATSVEAVLQIAARELGHALGAPMTIAQLGMKDQN
jgi:GAF domain-containing protein